MKPLTTEEIAALRGAVDEGDFGVAETAISRLLDEVERARALLKRIEWSGDRWGIDSDDRGCPACEGSLKTGGHSVRCELAALLPPEGSHR